MDRIVFVIIPIYNVEDYLPECMESVLSQTYQNLEIILVDDGSSDRSGEIVDSFAKRDNRIRVIHKENGGVSSARNAGIETAHGEYIYFMDPDDYMMPDAIKQMIDGIESEEADLCVTAFNVEEMEEGRVIVEKYRSLSKDSDFQNYSVLKQLSLLHKQGLLFSVWNKLFRAKIIKAGHMEFPEIPRLEDACFVYRYLMNSERIIWLDTPLYCCRIYKKGRISATQRFIPNEFTDYSMQAYRGGVFVA